MSATGEGGPAHTRDVASLIGAACLGLALTGYALGLAQVSRGSSAPGASPHVATAQAGSVEVAPAWSQLGSSRRGPNAGYRTRVPATGAPARDAAPGADLDPAARAEALARRAERRAYDGAPPVIPHPVEARAMSACLACHEHGLRLGAQSAPAIPHPPYASCTQCHAPAAPDALAAQARPWPANGFQGLSAPQGGERAWPGAPPVIPHATWMRQECLSCHGANGAAALRSTHPWRQSCTQCHAPRTRSP